MIVRDDASTLEACLASITPHVDEVIVVDTGSTDGSPEIARKMGAKVFTDLSCNDPETGLIQDFSVARNRSFAEASHDWVVWLDGDDIIEGAEHLRSICQKYADTDNVQILFPYEYQHDEQGRPVTIHYRERLMRPAHKWSWMCPVHEAPVQHVVEGSTVQDISDLTLWKHQQHKSTRQREVGRNLRILRAYVDRVGEGDHRALAHLGHEYIISGQTGLALRYLKRYVELSSQEDEVMAAMLSITRIYEGLEDWEHARLWAFRAMEQRMWPTPYFLLCRIYYAMALNLMDPNKNFARAAAFCEIGLAIPDPGTLSMYNPLERSTIHRYLSVCFARLGRLDKAIQSAEMGLKGLPDDELMLSQLKAYKAEQARQQIQSGLDHLGIDGDKREFLNDVISGNQELKLLTASGSEANQVEQPLSPPGNASGESLRSEPAKGCLNIIFYVGHGIEPWNPVTFGRTGLGGSETMAHEMSRRLARLGHRVRLYGHCLPTQEGVFEGVAYYDAARFKNLKCDVLIASRRPDAVDSSHNVEALVRILWVHDVHVGEALNHQRDLRTDRIFALTEWHKSFLLKCYPRINPNKILVTRNGIDLTRFDVNVDRNPHRAVYSSSPDRGLSIALELWPRIREQVQDAELHCYYGFGNWESAARHNKDQDQLRYINHLKEKLKTTPGVVFHDRVSQTELAKEFLKSGVWFYPTFFTETSCVTAMEAQEAGLRIVTSPLAALNETVGDRGTLIEGWPNPGEPMSKAYGDSVVHAVVQAMTEPEGGRAELRQYAETHFGLDSLAEEWSQTLKETVESVGLIVVPEFYDGRTG